MSYILEWKRKAFKNFNKLQKDVSLRISKKLEEVSLDPFRYLEHYEGDELFKLRIGEYRFLIDVDKDNKILIIQVFDKRPRAYVREEEEDYLD